MSRQRLYETLRVSQIKLLRLNTQNLQDTPRNDICGEFVIADLDASLRLQFTALSYAWGSERRPCQINISGHTVNVTESLFAILGSISRAKSSNTPTELTSLLSRPCFGLIWIDAICINQEDRAEKASQVCMMARIYGNASLTIMSLGDATTESRIALDWLTSIAGIQQAAFDAMTDDTKVSRLFDETAWNGLCDVILRLYFRRRWILEEAALSTDPWILCGEQVIDWTTFFRGYDRTCLVLFTLLHIRGYNLKTTDIEAIAGIGILRERLQQGRPIPLLEALVRFRRCNTVKERDRIFSLVGLCSDAEAHRIRISYNDDLRLDDLFKNQVVAHIATWNNLDILCICQERV